MTLAAAASLSLARSASQGPGSVAVWLSIDPRTGEITVYPPAVATRLEKGLADGAAVVPLAGLGGFYETAVIEFGGRSGGPTQRTANGGRRDVRRVLVAPGASCVCLNVVREGKWKIADFAAPGVTTEKRAALTGQAVPQGAGDTPGVLVPGYGAIGGAIGGPLGGGGLGAGASGPQESPEARQEIIEADDADGKAGFWEWCKQPEPDDVDAVPLEMWGHYSEAQNREIEDAYRKGDAGVQLCIGIRTYDLVFDAGGKARQVDRKMKKRRHVRRRALAADELYQLHLAQDSSNPGATEDDECPICSEAFAETSSMPVARLTECGHSFHAACVQQLADQRGQCPMCRAEVDWRTALKAAR